METKSIPKIELHCHLVGVIDAPLLRTVQRNGEAALIAPEEVLPPPATKGIEGFGAWLQSLGPYRFANYTEFTPILRAHIENLVDQNVTATEITMSPVMFPGDPDEKLAGLAAFVEQTRVIAQGRIGVDYLFVVPRALPLEKLNAEVAFYEDAKSAGLCCGIAVAGMDYDRDLCELFPALSRLKTAGLGIEIHTGEHTGPDEVAKVIASGLADRVGHGIRAFEDHALVKAIAKARTHLEFCPTSNLFTGAVSAYADLPFRRALDAGIPFSINTDDPGTFGCTMTSEFAKVAEAFDFGAREFAAIFDMSQAARFGHLPQRKAA